MRQAVRTGKDESIAVRGDGEAITLEFRTYGEPVAARLLTPERAEALASALISAAKAAGPIWDRLAEVRA